jgi:hypothetical protein
MVVGRDGATEPPPEETLMKFRLRRLALVATVSCFGTSTAMSADIAYISSASGYMVHDAGGTAVTANWAGQAPISGFSGYGAIRVNGRCLTAPGPAGQAVRWAACRQGDKAKIWALSNRRLNNELGWCADVEGNRQGAGVRLVAWSCHGAVNQQFKAHRVVSAQSVATRIPDPGVRQTFLQTAQTARPGAVISMSTGRLVGPDGGTLIAAGGQNMVAAGSGNLIAAGGLN